MTLIGRKNNFSGIVQHNTFNGGGTNVQTNSHRVLPPAGMRDCGIPCTGSAPRRHNISLYYTGFGSVRQECSREKTQSNPEICSKRAKSGKQAFLSKEKRSMDEKLRSPVHGFGSLLPPPRTPIVYPAFVTKS